MGEGLSRDQFSFTLSCCVLYTETIPFNQVFVFLLLAPPVFDKVKSTSSLQYIVGKGMKQTLTCVASGSPAPSVKFMKGKVELSGAKSNRTGLSVKMTLMYMANATADGGKITCVAKNSVKEVMHEIAISIIGVYFITMCLLWGTCEILIVRFAKIS